MKRKTFILFILSIITLIYSSNNVDALNNVNANKSNDSNYVIKYLNNKIKSLKEFPVVNEYPNKPGDILVTSDPYKGLIPTGHVGIVINKDEIIEATSDGVIVSRNDWIQTKKEVYGIRINDLPNQSDIYLKIIKYLQNNLNKKYNFNYLNTLTRNKFYCSHLAYSLFLDLFNINLDTPLFGKAATNISAIHPLELVLSKHAKMIYYQPFEKE